MKIESIQGFAEEVVRIYEAMEARRADLNFLGLSMSVRKTNLTISNLKEVIKQPSGIRAFSGAEFPKLEKGSKSRFLIELLYYVSSFVSKTSEITIEELVEKLNALSRQQDILPLSEEGIQKNGFVEAATAWLFPSSMTKDSSFIDDCRQLLVDVIEFVRRKSPEFAGSEKIITLKETLESELNAKRMQMLSRGYELEMLRLALGKALASLGGVKESTSESSPREADLTDSIIINKEDFLKAVTEGEMARDRLEVLSEKEKDLTADAQAFKSVDEQRQISEELARLRAEKEKLEGRVEQVDADKERIRKAAEENGNLHAQLISILRAKIHEAEAGLAERDIVAEAALKEAEERFNQQLLKTEEEKARVQQKANEVEKQREMDQASAREEQARLERLAREAEERAKELESLSLTNQDKVANLELELAKAQANAARLLAERQQLSGGLSRRDLDMLQADLVEANMLLQKDYRLSLEETAYINKKSIEKLIELRISEYEFADRFENLVQTSKDFDFDDLKFSNIKTIYSQLMMQHEIFKSVYAPLFEGGYRPSERDKKNIGSILSSQSDLSALFDRIIMQCRSDQNVSVSFSSRKSLNPAEKVYMQKSRFLKLCGACAEELAKRLENLAGRGAVKAHGKDNYKDFIESFAPFCQRNFEIISTVAEKKHTKSAAGSMVNMFGGKAIQPLPTSSVTVAAAFFVQSVIPQSSAEGVRAAEGEYESDVSSEHWSDFDEESNDAKKVSSPKI